MNKLLFRQLLVGCCFLLFTFTLQSQSLFLKNNFEKEESGKDFWTAATRTFDTTAFEGNYLHQADTILPFSLGMSFPLPDSLSHKNLLLIFSAAIRFRKPIEQATYVISLLRADSLLYWHGVKMDILPDSTGAWHVLSDEIKIPASYLEQAELKAYIWNPAGEAFDIDGIRFSLESFTLPSIMPELPAPAFEGFPKVLAQNRFYELLLFEGKKVVVADKRGMPLAGPLGYTMETTENGQKAYHYSAQWKHKRTVENGDKKSIQLFQHNRDEILRLTITAEWDSPQLHFQIESRQRRTRKIHRKALAIPFYDQPKWVFRKNSLADSSDFQQEYYLDSHGFIIGNDSRSITSYHQTGISSLQLGTESKTILFNLDYEKDHPRMHFPMRTDTVDFYEDLSAAVVKSKQKQIGHFRLLVGNSQTQMPRFMPVPGGYEAAIIWTEHADWTDIRTHRAVNFGHETIEKIEDAVGGFAKYRIPVTKSVFYHNPDSANNIAASDSLFTGLHASIKNDTAFIDLLKQLHQAGHDICLHTPEQYTSSRAYLSESMQFMQKHFGSPSWIDHGYNNRPENNRENLVCDGLLPYSPQFARDLWGKYGIRYFWSPYFEDVDPLGEWVFDGQMMVPYPGFGDAFPDKNISRHPDFAEALLWTTTGTLEIPLEEMWGYYFHPKRLHELIRFRSVHINHVYPAWVKAGKGFWRFDENDHIVASPGFNGALQNIAYLRDAGLLKPTTIASQLAYYEALQNIDYEIIGTGIAAIRNNNNFTIEGLSMAIRASAVVIEGKTIQSKRSGEDLIFWFDIGANEEVLITFE